MAREQVTSVASITSPSLLIEGQSLPKRTPSPLAASPKHLGATSLTSRIQTFCEHRQGTGRVGDLAEHFATAAAQKTSKPLRAAMLALAFGLGVASYMASLFNLHTAATQLKAELPGTAGRVQQQSQAVSRVQKKVERVAELAPKIRGDATQLQGGLQSIGESLDGIETDLHGATVQAGSLLEHLETHPGPIQTEKVVPVVRELKGKLATAEDQLGVVHQELEEQRLKAKEIAEQAVAMERLAQSAKQELQSISDELELISQEVEKLQEDNLDNQIALLEQIEKALLIIEKAARAERTCGPVGKLFWEGISKAIAQGDIITPGLRAIADANLPNWLAKALPTERFGPTANKCFRGYIAGLLKPDPHAPDKVASIKQIHELIEKVQTRKAELALQKKALTEHQVESVARSEPPPVGFLANFGGWAFWGGQKIAQGLTYILPSYGDESEHAYH